VAKRKPKETERVGIGLHVGFGKGGPYVRQWYKVFYDDGSSKIETGHTIFAWPGLSDLNPDMVPKSQRQLQKLTCRPDLDILLRVVHEAWDTLSGACWKADSHKDKSHGRSTKSNRRKNTRR
jgi:hypothetical protein